MKWLSKLRWHFKKRQSLVAECSRLEAKVMETELVCGAYEATLDHYEDELLRYQRHNLSLTRELSGVRHMLMVCTKTYDKMDADVKALRAYRRGQTAQAHAHSGGFPRA